MPNKLTVLPTLRTSIADTNARFLGVDISQLMEKAGKGISREILRKYGKRKSIAFLCGLGNNGGDGVAAARHLLLKGYEGEITVYLIGRSGSIHTSAAQNHWELLQQFNEKFTPANLLIKSDASAKDIHNSELLVECLVGTGIQGNLKKRFKDVVTRATHFRQQMIAIDVPLPGYTWDLSISMMYPKTVDAISINIGMPESSELYVGPGDVQALIRPKRETHKSLNGKILVFFDNSDSLAGMEAALAAGIYAGTIFIYGNHKSEIHNRFAQNDFSDYILVSEEDLEKTIMQVNSILFVGELNNSIVITSLLNHILKYYPEKKLILPATAIKQIEIGLVQESGNVVFILNSSDLPALLNKKGSTTELTGRLKRFALENNCYIGLLGRETMIVGKNSFTNNIDSRLGASGYGLWKNEFGKEFLSGIVAALASKNNIWTSLSGATFYTETHLTDLQESTTRKTTAYKNLLTTWEAIQSF